MITATWLRRRTYVATLGLVLAPLAATGETRSLSLDDAIASALINNERIVVERESLAAATAGISGARGAYDPLVQLDTGFQHATLPVNSSFSGAPAGDAAPTATGVDFGASLQRLFATGGEITLRSKTSRDSTDGSFALLSPSYGTQLGVELRQPLLRDRKIDPARLTVRLVAAEHDRATAALGVEVAETVAAVERAYWTLASARLAISVREESVRLAEEQLAETKIRIEKGAAPETEEAQPEAELARRRGELIAAREAAGRADTALKLLILGDGDTAAWTAALVPSDDVVLAPAAVDVAAAIEQALAARAEIARAVALTSRRAAESAAAANGRRPALDLVASYDRLGLAGSPNPRGSGIGDDPAVIPDEVDGGIGRSYARLVDGTFDDLRAGLSLKFTIGDHASRAAAAQARSAALQADAELAGVRKAIRAEVLDAALAIETAAQRIDAARAGRTAAAVQLSAERDRYAAGLSTNFLVLTRQNELSRAGLDEIAAQTDYRKARTELARATGSILKDKSIDVVPSRSTEAAGNE